MKDFLRRLRNIFLPILIFYSANKKIYDRIKKIDKGEYANNLKYILDYKQYSYEEIQPFYKKSIEIKKTLEDKAKISAVGITISTSIIVGLTGLLLNLNLNFFDFSLANITLLILCILVILHINISGILALLVIGNKNKVYQLFPENSKLDQKTKSEYLAIYTEQNTNMNIVRQNYVYSSFIHLIYSVVLMSLIFIFVTFNFNNDNKNKMNLDTLMKKYAPMIDNYISEHHSMNQEINSLKDSLEFYKSLLNQFEQSSKQNNTNDTSNAKN
ncbi:MAG: hypothetical protein A2057_15700 [Ignavibacteria bacterium GWA2_35_9]|nr:MAG: hypothetical protein A2057_15700 [Ignavibacteria bacterium GWA2_35_9]OGU44911.1 MAG: hypothetical protein A2000_07380 [Ignavibacteria bacterium GWB2_36_8]OGU51020.1 MAG: hypothetical protein A2080_08860 [Ignavibacteria bacterium GWC2_36_12]